MPNIDGESIAFWVRCFAASIFLVAALWTLKPLMSGDYAEFRSRISSWIALPATFGISYIQGKSIDFLVRATKRVLEVSAVKQMMKAIGLPLHYLQVAFPALVALVGTCGLMLCCFHWLSKNISRRGSLAESEQNRGPLVTEKGVA